MADVWEGEAPPGEKTKPIRREDRTLIQEVVGGFGKGSQRGMAGIAGMPVDIITTGMNALGANTQKPIGGSEWLLEKQQQLVGGWQPQSTAGRVSEAVGEQVPGLMIPAAGAAIAGLAGKVAPTTGNALSRVMNPTINPAGVSRTAPTVLKTVAKAAPSAVGSGIGVAAARELTPDNPYTELAGAILGGVAGGSLTYMAETMTNPNLDKRISHALRAIAPESSTKKQGLSGNSILEYESKNREATKAAVLSNRETPFYYVDESGAKSKTGLPTNRVEFAQAVDQLKTRIYKVYNDKQIAAGKKGLTFNGDALTEAIESEYNPEKNPGLAPSVTGDYAKSHAQTYYAGKQLTPQQMESELAEINARIYAQGKNTAHGDVSKFEQDKILKKVLVTALDKGIESLEGDGYQTARNAYTNVRNLQDTVSKAAIKQLNTQVQRGQLTQEEMYWIMELMSISGGAAVTGHYGVALGNAVLSLGTMGGRRALRYLHDPDTRLEKLFKTVDKYLDNPPKFAGPGSRDVIPRERHIGNENIINGEYQSVPQGQLPPRGSGPRIDSERVVNAEYENSPAQGQLPPGQSRPQIPLAPRQLPASTAMPTGTTPGSSYAGRPQAPPRGMSPEAIEESRRVVNEAPSIKAETAAKEGRKFKTIEKWFAKQFGITVEQAAEILDEHTSNRRGK